MTTHNPPVDDHNDDSDAGSDDKDLPDSSDKQQQFWWSVAIALCHSGIDKGVREWWCTANPQPPLADDHNEEDPNDDCNGDRDTTPVSSSQPSNGIAS